MKRIYQKHENKPLFVQNSTGEPEIVLVFPITRDGVGSSEKWETVLEFVDKSEIKVLLVIDKTERLSATEYFMNQIILNNKRLLVLPRSIKDTLFDTVGEILLDRNMWIIQVHDDDRWIGEITLPDTVDPETVYSFDFYLHSEIKGTIKIKDYSMPNRIVFSLVPSKIWNRFSKLVQDQKYHVAGSFDFTLNRMVQLSCKFEPRSGYAYYWKDDNWDTSKNAFAHLTKLAESDGWKDWSSPEIANLNRSIDSLASLNSLKDMLTETEIGNEIKQIIDGFRPSTKRKFKYGILIPTLRAEIEFRKILVPSKGLIDLRSIRLQKRLSLYQLIVKTWSVESIENVIDLIVYIESLVGFEKLQVRFQFWKQALTELDKVF